MVKPEPKPWGGTTCLTLLVFNTASFVLCVVFRVKDHHHLLHYSPRLKKTCVRQVALDRWLPLKAAVRVVGAARRVAGEAAVQRQLDGAHGPRALLGTGLMGI